MSSRLKSALTNQYHSDLSRDLQSRFLQSRNVYMVYASLTENKTWTLPEIVKKTGLTRDDVEEALKIMCDIEIVLIEHDKYRAHFETVKFSEIQKSINFTNAYQEELRHLLLNSKDILNDKNSLCYFATVSIQPKRAKEFKTALTDLLNQFLDEAHSEDGESVARLTCSLTTL